VTAHRVKISCDFPIVGVVEIEANTEAEALAIATDRYGKDKKNFNVEIIQEEEFEKIRSVGDVRQSGGSNDPAGGNVSSGGSPSSKEAPKQEG